MKNYLIILVLLLLGSSCNTLSIQEEITQSANLQTRAMENPKKYALTITSNIDESIIISQVVQSDYPHTYKDWFEFTRYYQDSLYETDAVLLLPDPVWGKIWTGIQSNSIIDYDTTTNNEYGAPYLKAYISQAVDINFIYRDSASHNNGSGGGNSGGGTTSPEFYYTHQIYYTHYTHLSFNNYRLYFRTNEMTYGYKDFILVEYSDYDHPNGTTAFLTNLTGDVFTLDVKAYPTLHPIHIYIPEQINSTYYTKISSYRADITL